MKTLKLNQVNSILTQKKPETEKFVTELYKIVQKEALFSGRERQYRPLDEINGQKLPPESQKVQQRVDVLLSGLKQKWEDLWSFVLTQDSGNQKAVADIVVDGNVLAKNVPISTLLYLDKQVNDLETFINKLPTPCPSEEWTQDQATGLLKSKSTESVRTSKEPTVIVKYEATEKHPAQTELFTKDVPVGTWTQILYSGSIQVSQKEELLKKVRKVQEAIKIAKENANSIEVERQSIKPLLDFIF